MNNIPNFLNFFKEGLEFKDGVYISVKPNKETETKLKEYQEKYLKEIKDIDINKKLHCTLIYSKKIHQGQIKTNENKYNCSFKSFNKFGEDSDILVLELDSKDLVNRNNELVQDYDFISDFDEYSPHITLGYNCKNLDISKLPKIDFEIVLENEVVDNLDLDWTSK